jgi:hypothetical protein
MVLLLSASCALQAQDLLVTVRYDTLNCDITSFREDVYSITFMLGDSAMTGKIHKDSVLYIHRNMFRALDDNRLRPWYPVTEFGIDAGMAHQVGYLRKEAEMRSTARTGIYGCADLTYYMTKTVGYGLKYSFRSVLGGDIKYQHIGPMMMFRFWNSSRHNYAFLGFSAGLGWLKQTNAPIQIGLSYRPLISMRANYLSGDVSAGYCLRLSPTAFVRLKASFNMGRPGFVRVVNLLEYADPGDKTLDTFGYCENTKTVNLSAGFSFHARR